MNDIVQIFKALGDETRFNILLILCKKRICAKGIAKHLNISEAAVSQHLKVLKDAGIIKGEKIGYYVHYDLQKCVLSEMIDFITKISDDSSLNNFRFQIPEDCKATCKEKKNKCCQNKNRER